MQRDAPIGLGPGECTYVGMFDTGDNAFTDDEAPTNRVIRGPKGMWHWKIRTRNQLKTEHEIIMQALRVQKFGHVP